MRPIQLGLVGLLGCGPVVATPDAAAPALEETGEADRTDGADGSDGSDGSDSSDGSGVEQLPEALSLEASADRGFYDAPFELILTASEPGAAVSWTVDGSDPATSASALEGTSPVRIAVDPASAAGRDPAPGFVVRARAWHEDSPTVPALTHTYLFVDQVAALSPHDARPGPGWPQPYETNDIHDALHAMDYGLDPRVTDPEAYGDLLDDALLAIPSVAVSLDLAHLFDAETGIYVNPMGHGTEWERPGSFEILDPDDAREVQVGAGVRIRGGWSRHQSNPKHAFRFFFRSDYGDSKLRFPLFGDAGADEYDKIDQG